MKYSMKIFVAMAGLLWLSFCASAQGVRLPVKPHEEAKVIEVKNNNTRVLSQPSVDKNAKEIWWEENQVYTVVEEMPQYPGGIEAMYKYFGDNLVYPAEAQAAAKEGSVILSFIVEKDGSIREIEILKDDVGYGAAEAASKVVSSMPLWTPGKQDGKPVRVKIVNPFKFKLPK